MIGLAQRFPSNLRPDVCHLHQPQILVEESVLDLLRGVPDPGHGPLHVGLAGAEPDVPEGHVLESDDLLPAGELERVARAGRPGAHHHRPGPVRAGGDGVRGEEDVIELEDRENYW